MKINGYEYSKEEVLEALERKGYQIVTATFYHEEHIHGSTFIKHHYTTECALCISDQTPNEANEWHLIAKKEFEKKPGKPPLI
ncbi:hypothetical protein [Chryseobacterium koreense]